MERVYQICKRCVMDTTDPDIIFDNDGNCNHCSGAISRLNYQYFKTPEEKSNQLNKIIDEIRKSKGNNNYDCIIGLSGGVDSSYLAYLIKSWGLNPLAIHVDNGWNSELAVKNIENIVKILNIDLYTHVIDWEEFKDLQLAFLKSSVIDLEMLTDNAIVAGIYFLAKKHNIKYFLDGVNISTESIMPASWYYSVKVDGLNIRSIYKEFGKGKKLRTYPTFNFIQFIRYFKGGIKQVSPLNYIEYNKVEAKKLIEKQLLWRDYGGKHYESRITQFYQAYILPTKFNVDKRKAHLSSLICSNQMTREEAQIELQRPLYDSKKFDEDYEFFLKKLELSKEQFSQILTSPPKRHEDYKNYLSILNRLIRIRKIIKWKK